MVDFAKTLLDFVARYNISFKMERCPYSQGFLVHLTKEHSTITIHLKTDYTFPSSEDYDHYLEDTLREGTNKLLEQLKFHYRVLEKFRHPKLQEDVIKINLEELNDTESNS